MGRQLETPAVATCRENALKANVRQWPRGLFRWFFPCFFARLAAQPHAQPHILDANPRGNAARVQVGVMAGRPSPRANSEAP